MKLHVTMDVEDYYHLDYNWRPVCFSYLSGLDRFLDFCEKQSVVPTLFVLSEVSWVVRAQLERAIGLGGEVALHGRDHTRPLKMSEREFRQETWVAKDIIQQNLGVEVVGYRAPCFSLDRERLDILSELGFSYDSSFINVPLHPLYGQLDLSGFQKLGSYEFVNGQFKEYGINVWKPRLGKIKISIPYTGGGFLRLLPVPVILSVLKRELMEKQIITTYLHPFEFFNDVEKLSQVSFLNNFRARYNIGENVSSKLKKIVNQAQSFGYVSKTLR